MAFVRVISRKSKTKTYHYAYLVESFWDPEKRYTDHKALRSFGAVSHDEAKRLQFAFNSNVSVEELEKLDGIEIGRTLPVGDVYLAHHVWRKWGMEEVIAKAASPKFKIPAADILKIMTINRLVDPRAEFSIQYWYENLSGLREITGIEPAQLYYRRLYRYTKELDRIFPQLCKALKKKLQRLVHGGRKVDVAFYDITSTFFQSSKFCLIAAYGYSRDKRRDKKQVVVALVCDRFGFPFHAEVLPGNTADKTTVPDMVAKLKNEFGLTDCILVGDRGMISRDNFKSIEDAHMGYLMALTRAHIAADLKEHEDDILALKDKHTLLIDKDESHYIVYFNQEKKDEEKAGRARRLERMRAAFGAIEKMIASGRAETQADVGEQVGKAKQKYKCGKYINWAYNGKTKELSFEIKEQKVAQDEKWDGLLVLKSNRKKMKNTQSVDLYKDLQNVERAFKSLKSVLDIRPIHHHTDPYVRGHIYICILSYLIERYIGFILHKHGVKTTVKSILKSLSTINIGEIVSPDGHVMKKSISHIPDDQKEILSHFGITRRQMTNEILGEKTDTP